MNTPERECCAACHRERPRNELILLVRNRAGRVRQAVACFDSPNHACAMVVSHRLAHAPRIVGK